MRNGNINISFEVMSVSSSTYEHYENSLGRNVGAFTEELSGKLYTSLLPPPPSPILGRVTS